MHDTTASCRPEGYPRDFYSIGEHQLRDKIDAYWLAQQSAISMGFPFENLYQEAPNRY